MQITNEGLQQLIRGIREKEATKWAEQFPEPFIPYQAQDVPAAIELIKAQAVREALQKQKEIYD